MHSHFKGRVTRIYRNDMVKKLSIGSKITALVLAVVLSSALVIGFVAFDLNKRSVKEQHLEALKVIAGLKSQKLETFFGQIRSSLLFAQQTPALNDHLTALGLGETDTVAYPAAKTKVEEMLSSMMQNESVRSVYLTNAEGVVLYTSDGSESGSVLNDLSTGFLKLMKDSLSTDKSVVFSHPFTQNQQQYLFAASRVQNGVGFIISKVNLGPVFSALNDTTGLGATGEIILAAGQAKNVKYLNPLRNQAESKEANFASESIREVIGHKAGIGTDKDYRYKSILAAWQPVPVVNWGLVVKMDADEVYGAVNRMRSQLLFIGLIILGASVAIGFIFSKLLINPLLSLKANMDLLGQGILPENIENNSNDEIGEMTDTVNHLVEGLRKTADFAHKIGEGNFDADFKPISENDTLGLALINMRDSIQSSAKRDDEQNWIVTGVAEMGDILRSTNNLDELGDRVTSYLTNKIGAIQGAFYVVNDEEEGEPVIEMTASFAYHKKKYLQGRFRFAEGLVGQAAIEQDTILRTEVPDSYVTITSGLLGDRKPKCILIIPLITVVGSEKQVFGVMEFAGFEKFSKRNVRFVNEVSEIIARTVFNIKVNETTRKLLEQSQRQSEELQVQQEVLRQNAEEMQATQEELKRSNQQLEVQIEQVNHAQKRMQVLLENASEIITIYDASRTIRFVSPSIRKILGYSPEEMIGLNDIIHVHEKGVESVDQMFDELLLHPERSVTVQFSYMCKSGERVWLEATGTNRLTDPAISGLVINTRDITERRKAEKETRMRGQMQALSENSPDLITRFNKEGRIFYINPIIESYSGQPKDEFFQKQLEELTLDSTVVDAWKNILQTVVNNQEKVSAEMAFPSTAGNRVMQVNAIPEYNEQSTIESVLLVSHDITERKMAELEIESQNRKITESINYARRIQGAILPDNEIIRTFFPGAFILYKPRDVVSGDFPWFMQKGDDLYIAAVDCTGHGVPGALISIIGYFLLNDIIGNQDDIMPGEALDKLDQAVTRTLRQDGLDASSRDGMDIALCKINLKKQKLHFAGAHRSLYYMKSGELMEVKADKFPIGGGQYQNRTNFTTTEIKLDTGDRAYFCSDGFPDQFGGPENRKFSPKRIRDIITGHQDQNINEVYQVFDTEFEAWKGGNKQTDDVLMIGIQF